MKRKQRIKDRRDKQEEERQDEKEKASANDYIYGEEGEWEEDFVMIMRSRL